MPVHEKATLHRTFTNSVKTSRVDRVDTWQKASVNSHPEKTVKEDARETWRFFLKIKIVIVNCGRRGFSRSNIMEDDLCLSAADYLLLDGYRADDYAFLSAVVEMKKRWGSRVTFVASNNQGWSLNYIGLFESDWKIYPSDWYYHLCSIIVHICVHLKHRMIFFFPNSGR